MPPKRKDKGGKGGKGAAAVPNAVDEPRQPDAGSPFNLSLMIEVSLLVDPTAVAADGQGGESGGDAGKDSKCSKRQTRQLLIEPVFRYTFVNGDRITTPPVGLAGSSWTKLSPPAAMGDAAPKVEQSTTAALETRGTTELEGKSVFDNSPGQPVVWRYTRIHRLQGADEDEVALTLDRRSSMLVTLADKSEHAATVQPPGGGGTKNDPPADEPASGEPAKALPGRNFIESWPLDLSAFLAGETAVSLCVGGGDHERKEAKDPPFTPKGKFSRESFPPSSAGDERRPDGVSSNDASDMAFSGAPSAPDGVRFLRITVSLPGAEAVASGMDEGPTSALEGSTATVGARHGSSTNFLEGEGIHSRRKKLLSVEAMERLNPLSICISSAACLPGVRVEAESLQDYVKPTPFRLLDLHCKPVYVVCRPFPGDPSGGLLHPRIVWTAGFAQRDRVSFNHTSSFLLGRMDRHRVEEWVENSTLSIEVHDRDPRPSAEEQRERVLRFERMVAGGYPEEDGANDSLAGAVSQSKAKEETRSGDGDVGEDPSPARFTAPVDIYEVDELALREALAEAETAGRHCAHGVASFRLSGLLDQSRQLVVAYSNGRRNPDEEGGEAQSSPPIPAAIADVAPRLKFREDICPRKRREIPKGGVEAWHFSDEERLVRWPGAYLDAGSTLGLRLSLARPLRTLREGSAEGTGPPTEEPRPFSRAVLVVEYEEGGALVRDVAAEMDRINGRALVNVQGSLRAYVLTREEKQAADDGTLNIVCGFMIIDDDSRTIVLEGLSGPKGGLAALLRKVERSGPNGQGYRALENPQVRFSRRLYTSFDADLKKVRLRDPLPILCQNPEVYDRSKVSAECFDALHCLRMLRKVNRLREAAEQGLFPGAAQLVQVESKYGESVSIKDITGRNPTKKKKGKNAGVNDGPAPDATAAASAASAAPKHATATALPREKGEGNSGVHSGHERQAAARRKAPTDSTNAAFEEWLRGRRPRDFLAEQDEHLAAKHEEFVERQRRKEQERMAETVRTDWCYGPQKLNYVELKKAEMRERLAKDKGATYTYSMDYVSQTVCVVDEFRVKEDAEATNRAAWKTNRGFVWPCPRTRQELITHPSKPSQSRIDALREPWVENELNGGAKDTVGTTSDKAGDTSPELAWRPNFDTVPSNGKAVFGGLQPPKYARPLDTGKIGSRSRLPRGRQKLEKDPQFFRSVHLVGGGLAREREEAKRVAEELWRSKVVVDDTDFRVGSFSVRDTPLQVDRAKDILRPPVKKTAFKIVRNARLPSGKRTTLQPPPVSDFSLAPYTDPQNFTASFRGNNRERWITDTTTGEKQDFALRLHAARMQRKSQKACTRMKHPPLQPWEMQGARWETHRSRQEATTAGEE